MTRFVSILFCRFSVIGNSSISFGNIVLTLCQPVLFQAVINLLLYIINCHLYRVSCVQSRVSWVKSWVVKRANMYFVGSIFALNETKASISVIIPQNR